MICLHCLNWAQSSSIPLAGRHGWDVARGSGGADEWTLVGNVAAVIAEIVARLHKGVEEIVNVEELKTHIHSELFGDRFPTSIPISEWKDQHKKTVMRRAVKVMQLSRTVRQRDYSNAWGQIFLNRAAGAGVYRKRSFQFKWNKGEYGIMSVIMIIVGSLVTALLAIGMISGVVMSAIAVFRLITGQGYYRQGDSGAKRILVSVLCLSQRLLPSHRRVFCSTGLSAPQSWDLGRCWRTEPAG